jgi:hypothetical protein
MKKKIFLLCQIFRDINCPTLRCSGLGLRTRGKAAEFFKTRKIRQVSLIAVRLAKPLSAVRWADYSYCEANMNKRYLLFSIILILVCGFSADCIYWAAKDGYFASWTEVEEPPENIIQVLASGLLEGESGKKYQYKLQCNNNCWEEITPDEESLRIEFPISDCDWYPSNNSGYIEFQKSCNLWHHGHLKRIIARTSEGKILLWESPYDNGYIVIGRIFYPIIGSFLGVILGLAFIFILTRKNKK